MAILTVNDPDASAAWYASTLSATVETSYTDPESGQRSVCLTHPSGLEICLRNDPGRRGDTFDESRIGLDHLELLVPNRSDLDEWRDHLDALGVSHSGIKQPSYSRNAMITFRDPDNIQLELFWSGRSAPENS